MMLIDYIESLLIVGLIPITCIIAIVAIIEHLPVNLSAAHRSWLWRSVYVKAATLVLLPAWCVVPFHILPSQGSSHESPKLVADGGSLVTNTTFLEKPGDNHTIENVSQEVDVAVPSNSIVYTFIGPVIESLESTKSLLRASRIYWMPLWGLGFMALLLWGVREYFRLRSEISSGTTQAQANVLSIAITTAQQLGVRGNPKLRLSNQVSSPLLLMGPRIELVLPSDFDQRFGREACQMAIAHELAHYHRRDLYWNLLVSVVTAAYFFWPPLWFAGRRYYVAMEMACDQFAIRRAKLDLIEYANLLIRLLEPANQRSYPSAVLSMAWSGTFRSLSERIRFMKMEAKSRNAMRMITSAFSLAIGLMIVIPWGLAEDKPKKNKKNESITDSSRYEKEKTEPTKKKSNSASASASSSSFGFGSSSGSGSGFGLFSGSGGSGGGNAGAQSNGSVIAGGSASASVSVSSGDDADEKTDYFVSPGDGKRLPVPTGSGMQTGASGSKSQSNTASSKVSSVNGTSVTRTVQDDEDGDKISITTIRNKKTEVTIRESEMDGILVGITDLRKGQKKTPQFFESDDRETLKKEHPEAYEWVKKYGEVSSDESIVKPNLRKPGSTAGSMMMGSGGGSSFAGGSSFGGGGAGGGVNLDGGQDARQLLRQQIRQMLDKTDDPLTRQNLEQLLKNVDGD